MKRVYVAYMLVQSIDLTSVQGRIAFTREELDGVQEDVISGYPQRTEGDKVLYEVAFRTPDIFPLVSVL